MNNTIIGELVGIGKKLVDGIFSIFDKVIVDKDLNEKLKAETKLKIAEWEFQQVTQLIKNESASTSKFVTWWRPAIMWICVIPTMACYGLWNNVVYPVLTMITTKTVVKLELDAEFILLAGGITGLYILSRSFEKVSHDKKEEKK